MKSNHLFDAFRDENAWMSSKDFPLKNKKRIHDF